VAEQYWRSSADEAGLLCPGGFPVDVALLTHAEDVAALQPQWDALLAASARPRPSLMYDWFAACSRHFSTANGREPAIVCFRDSGRLVGIAPLRLSGVPLLRTLQSAVEVADCRDLVIESGAEWAVVRALIEWLTTEYRGWDLLRMRGMCSRSPTHDFLPLLAGHAGLKSAAWRADPCANIDLPGSMEEFLEQMPGQRRRRVYAQYGRKLAREHGEPEFRVVAGEEVTEADVAKVCELHRDAWTARGGSCVMDGRFRGFLADRTSAAAPAGQPVLTFLRLGDRDIAGHYGFLLGGRFFLYVIGFDAEFASYSVGAQALLALIEHGIAQGWTEIDLMKGGERYKFDFTRTACRAADVWVAKSARRLQVALALAALRGRVSG